jgi:hypothetical protein
MTIKNNNKTYMKKESKEMLKTIISNQELIMKALKIENPVKEIKKVGPKKPEVKKAPVKKIAAEKSASKTAKK